MSKRAREEVAPSTLATLPRELQELVLIVFTLNHGPVAQVCRAWRDVLARYSGWEALARSRYTGAQERIEWYLLPMSTTDAAQRLFTQLDALPRDPRTARFRAHVARQFCALRLDWSVKSRLLTQALVDYVASNADNALTLRNFHPRDLALTFQEADHRYQLVLGGPWRTLVSRAAKHDDDEELRAKADGSWPGAPNRGLRSTTGFIHTLFPVFDPDAKGAGMFERKAEWERWERIGWHECPRDVSSQLRTKRDEWLVKYPSVTTLAELKALWEAGGAEASRAGTAMHANLEYYYTERSYESVSREFALFREFERAHVEGKLRAFRTEWTIYNEALRLCGSVDILYEYVNSRAPWPPRPGLKKRLVVMDWKRSKKLVKFTGYTDDKRTVPATAGCLDCNYTHYTIQLCLYKWMLEQSYDVVIDAMFLVVLHPDQEHYILEPVEWHDALMQAILAHRRAQIEPSPLLLDAKDDLPG